MNNTFAWYLPAHFMVEPPKRSDYIIDLTEHFKVLVSNEFWKRSIHYDRRFLFDGKSLDKIKSVRIKIFPFSDPPFNVDQVATQLFREANPDVPQELQYIIDRGNLRAAKSLVVVEIDFESEKSIKRNLLHAEEFTGERYFNIDMEFGHICLEMVSVASEMISLLMAALHLTFSTRYPFPERLPQTSGLYVVKGPSGTYYSDEHSDIATHPILLEEDRFAQLKEGLNVLSTIWHKELWMLHRMLKALRTNAMTIDDLLDLVYALESLFPNGTGSDMMRLTAALIVGKDKGDAKKKELTLRTIFKLRNEIVHGGRHYELSDYFELGKEKFYIADLFFDLKYTVVMLVIYAIKKVDPNGQQNKLSVGMSDLFELFY